MVADVTIVGTGLIGLASAAALAERGARVRLVGTAHPGEASPAAAGMLAPSVERASGPAHDFAVASRDVYPAYLDALKDRTGISVPLNRLGVLQVALNRRGVSGLRKSMPETAEWLDAPQLAALEPALSHALGAVLNPLDGAVDNVILVQALRRLVSTYGNIHTVADDVAKVHIGIGSATVYLLSGEALSSETVVLCAGAWTGLLGGALAAAVVEPVRGQLVSYQGAPLAHVVYGPSGYLVPRADGHTIAGSTMERVGFLAEVTDAGIAKVRAAGEEICPALTDCAIASAWAGLRPITPDLLPLLGPDPAHPNLIYACGHSRNGVLLTPLTGEVVADLTLHTAPKYDLRQFRPDRF